MIDQRVNISTSKNVHKLARFSIAKGLFPGAAMAAPAAMAFLIHRYAVNLPYSDEWDTIGLVIDARRGSLQFAQLWQQHNEHRLFIANIISVVLGSWSDCNLVANMYCGFAFQLLALLLVWRILVLTLRANDAVLIKPLTVIASLLMFWTVSTENWTWGISSIEFLSGVFWAVAAIWVMAEWRRTWRATLLGFVFAALAILTSGAGFPVLLIVPAGTIVYGWQEKHVPWPKLIFLTAASFGLMIVFFIGWHAGPGDSRDGSLNRLVTSVAYFFAYLGSPFDSRYHWKLALLAGLAGTSLLVLCLWRMARTSSKDEFGNAVPWVLVALYSLLNAGLTAYARSWFGLGQAMSPRYSSIAILFWFTLVVLSLLVYRSGRRSLHKRSLRAVLAIVLAVSTAVYGDAYYKGLMKLRYHYLAMNAALRAVRVYRQASDNELNVLHPNPSQVRKMSQELEQYHLGPFAAHGPE